MHDIDHQKLLQGGYEPERLRGDYKVPDFAYNILNQAGLLYRPIIDEHRIQQKMEKPKWPDGKPFAVCLTHDVDYVSAHSILPAFRRKQIQWKTETSATKKILAFQGAGLSILRAVKYGTRMDPLFCFERWLEAENVVGAHSTFFFWPGTDVVSRQHQSDCGYTLSDKVVFDGQRCNVAEMVREIHCRGWEIGLHPSWYSFDDVDELRRQKDAIEKAIDHKTVSVRQHFLHYDILATPRVQYEAGFQYDSTLGFNDNIGFRFGTSYPWQLYDLKSEETLPIFEVPLIIQDGAMLSTSKGMRLDEETAFQYVKLIAQAVENVGGVLTLLWHPHEIVHDDWWHLYLRTLAYLRKKNACFGSVKEIMALYATSNHMFLTP